MSRVVKNYSKEFKQKAITEALQSESLSRTAKSLSIPLTTLHSWVAKARKLKEHTLTTLDHQRYTINVTELVQKLQSLTKRIQDLELENEILKKIQRYFD